MPDACWWSLGAFIQFYMRAGVFTDGGKIERERAAAKLRKRLTKGQDRVQAVTGK